ncbi:MAG TPA: electron transport complex subunit RsxC [Nitrospirae bacterium]|nr:electron transport complex protein RnfC [bacterium BMS3Abin06]HDH12196.1 electron transport complex subunit RsxC [Nitrospirota bacterium]HDZ03136.1 electron transport complex subunit RsxC [Nitrospirota bacterium]
MGKTATFERGIHPRYHKDLTAGKSIAKAKLPQRIVVPVSQHIGAPAKPEVGIGDEVKRGQVIGSATGFVCSPVHSSISGKVTAIADFPTAAGKMVQSIVIESDGKDEAVDFKENPDYMNLGADDIKAIIKDAGIVGMGGAAFPTNVKLSPPKEKTIDTVIINGAECEPYLTADHRLMVERPKEVVEGLKIIMKSLGVNEGHIGIEENKPDAIEAMKSAVAGESNIEVRPLEIKYPQGAEKMLIKAIKGREVPIKGLPMDVGVVVQNVGTALAVYEAVRYGKPLIERVVTITGTGIKEPANMMVRIGTLMSDVVEQCGGLVEGAVKVISGGPMMGFAQWTLDVPVVKGTSGILVLAEDEYVSSDDYSACIRCGSCIDVCPMGLNPSMLSILSEKGFFEEAKEYNLFDCFECGSCAYVCPAKRPMVQFIRLAKSQVKP